MDRPMYKSYESNFSTTGTTTTPPLSDNLENNVKYMNVNFMDNSESSSQAKEPVIEYSKIEKLPYEPGKATKPPPSKILPTTFPFSGKQETLKQRDEPTLKEKTLVEMGFNSNEIEGWENIVQPPKENLYKLLKNMIDNHIKPNVQIRIGSVTFNCHMMVLQCYSDFFMDCNNEVLIQLPEEKITPGAFMMVYDWMLAEEPLVQREGILELFNAANFLRIKDLINQCWLCLDDDVRFREDTAFLLYLEARVYGLEALEQLMLSRICKFFLTLVSSKEFLNLNANEICTLLSSNTIGVNSEVEIFMSVVRWLSHNWEERERDMLSVIKCVRFSLMPPWFLVTLNKNTDCEEIDRIVGHPEIKRMINDGISYTTTQLYYGENREEFLHFLERYQLVAPMQRQWVFDKECNYHHRLECPNMQYVTYKSFLEYLEMIQTIGKGYWRSLEMAKGVEKSMQCCVRSDCRKLNEPNLASIFTKSNRDKSVQVEDSASKTQVKDLRRKGKKSKKLADPVKSNKQKSNASSITCSSVNTNVVRESAGYQKHQNCIPNVGRDTEMVHHESTSMDQKINFEKPNIINKDVENTIGDGPRHANLKFKIPVLSGAGDGDGDGFVDKNFKIFECLEKEVEELINPRANANFVKQQQLIAIKAKEFNSIGQEKILIFGGVDPYCRHCLLDEVMSDHPPPIQQQQMEKKYKSKQTFLNDIGIGVGQNCNSEMSNCGDEVLCYDETTLQWRHLSHIPFGSRHHHVAVVCNGLIYVIGGTRIAYGCTKKSMFEKSVWSLNPKTLKWTLESSLPESRRDFAAVAIDEKCEQCQGAKGKDHNNAIGIFVIGGEGINGMALNTVWFYNVTRKIWIEKASLNVGRYGLAATIINNEIWIAGGIINDRSLQQNDDNIKDCGRGCNGIANDIGQGDNRTEIQDKIVDVITDSMEYYSLKCIKSNDIDCSYDGNNVDEVHADMICTCKPGDVRYWMKAKTHLRVPRLFGRLCKMANNEVFLIGGIGLNTENLLSSLSSVDRYNFKEHKWEYHSDINYARHGHDVVAFNERIVIIGGVSTISQSCLTSVETFCHKTRKSFIDVPELPWPISGSAVVTYK